MNSFIFVATALLLLHLNQPLFTSGRQLAAVEPDPDTWFPPHWPYFPPHWRPTPETPTPATPTPAKPTPTPATPTPATPTPVIPTPATPPVTPTPEIPTPEAPTPEIPTPAIPTPETPALPTPSAPALPTPATPTPATPEDPPSEDGTCKMNYGSCVKFFKGLIQWEEGDITAGTECCSLFGGLVQYESAWCMCKTFKGEFFGIKFDIPVAVNMTMNFCNKKLPKSFSCP